MVRSAIILFMEERTAYLILLIAAILCLLIGLLEYRIQSRKPYGFPMIEAGFKVSDVKEWNRRIAILWMLCGGGLMLDLFLFRLTHFALLTALIVIAIFVAAAVIYLKKLVPAFIIIPDDEELWKDVKKK